MNYHHLTIEERCCIREYYRQGKSFREIARLIGRSPSTISREIMRNKTFMNTRPAYYPHTAQKKYLIRRSYCHRGMFWQQELVNYIEEKLLLTWSPEQIANSPSPYKMPSFKTIYRWIYDKYLLNGNKKVLRHKGKKYNETRGKIANKGKSIRKRDKSVYKRKEFGHWEMDTVVSGRGKSKSSFVTLAERKTRYYIAIKVNTREAKEVSEAVIKEFSKLPQRAVKTITTDNGSEFARWEEIEKALKTQIYFADPYCAWQKGTNENCNGLLREFYPKGRNLSRVSPVTLKKNLALINARPKKILNYIKPIDLFNDCLTKCCT